MIYVFRTSVKYKNQIKKTSNKINEINGIQDWNFDLEDCDNILRIEANKDITKKICRKLNSLNYTCEEL